MSTSGKSKGISLGDQTRWVVSDISDFGAFFRGLNRLLSSSDAMIYMEGTSISPDVRDFLAKHSVAGWHEVLRGTIWPQPSVFHLPASPDVLIGLTDLASHHAYPEIADHCHVYTRDGMILQWYDACDPGCPLGIGPEIPGESVRAFCDFTGARYKTYELRSLRGTTHSYKLWTLRLVSIPALLYLPIACAGIGIFVSHENKGDSFPLVSLLSLLGGLVAAGVLSRYTLFARIDGSLKRCFWVLASIIIFDVAVMTIRFFLS